MLWTLDPRADITRMQTINFSIYIELLLCTIQGGYGNLKINAEFYVMCRCRGNLTLIRKNAELCFKKSFFGCLSYCLVQRLCSDDISFDFCRFTYVDMIKRRKDKQRFQKFISQKLKSHDIL